VELQKLRLVWREDNKLSSVRGREGKKKLDPVVRKKNVCWSIWCESREGESGRKKKHIGSCFGILDTGENENRVGERRREKKIVIWDVYL
jgi:hypothetical protein